MEEVKSISPAHMIVASVVSAKPCDMNSVTAGRTAANAEVVRSSIADIPGIHTSDSLTAPSIRLEYGYTGPLRQENK